MAKKADEILRDILNSPQKDEQLRAKLKEAGLDGKNANKKAALIYCLYELAKSGNSKAVDTVLLLSGEKPLEIKGQNFLDSLTFNVKIL